MKFNAIPHAFLDSELSLCFRGKKSWGLRKQALNLSEPGEKCELSPDIDSRETTVV